MDSRERVVRAIEMTGPDRLPIFHSALHGFTARYPREWRTLRDRYADDFAATGFKEPEEFGAAIGVEQDDGWGAIWVRTSDEHKGLIVKHPLSDWSALDTYQFPDPLVIDNWSAVPETLAQDKHQKYVMVDGYTLFQRMFYLRGMENLLLDFGEGRQELYYLRDRIVAFMLRKIEKWLEYDIDGVRFRDDWGTQLALLISPRQWREFFKLAYEKLFAAVHAGGKHVWFHSDGVISSIIPDLVELGANVLNPQFNCIGIPQLAALAAGKVCLLGDVDRQYVLPFGSPAEVAASVGEAVETFASHRGGYVARGELAGDVPLANAEAMYAAFASYRYEDGRLCRG